MAELLRAARQDAAALAVEAEAQQRLARFDAHLSAGAFSEAAWCMLELRQASAGGDAAEAVHDAVSQRCARFSEVTYDGCSRLRVPVPVTIRPLLPLGQCVMRSSVLA